jgi:hypothetical protein
MGKLSAPALLLAACAEPPAAVVRFEEADAESACIAQEDEWFAAVQRVWLSARAEPSEETLALACVEAAGAASWADLETRLRGDGDLLSDVPVGPPFHLYLMAVHEDGCPGAEGPTTGDIGFCAYTVDPVVLAAGRDVDVRMRRHCFGLLDADACFERAARDRE